MRNLKRVLTLVMAIAMMMSLLVVGAGAAFNDQNKIENTEAVNMNVALGVIKGRDTGDFDPAGNVTRAEMAKMICVMLNGGNEPTLGTKAAPVFTDIKGHWAEAYIEYCASLGIIAGMGDGTFAPNANVTGTQAAKMLLVALGYDAAFEGFNGASWSVKINVAANQKVLYDELAIDPNAALNRDDAAQMIWNALNAVEVKYTYSLTTVNGQLQNVQVREDKDTDLLVSKFKTAADYERIMIGYSYDTDDEEYTYTFKKAGAEATNPTFKSETDYTALFGLNVNIVYKNNTSKTVYGMYAEDSKVLATGIVGDLDTSSATEIEFDDVKYDIDYTAGGTAAATLNALPVYAENVWTASDYATATLSSTKYYEARLIDVDDNGDVDYLVYAPFTVGEVTYMGSKTVTVSGLGSKDLKDINYYDGMKKDDYVKVIAAANTADNTITLQKVDKMVDGKVTKISGSNYYIDGASYKLAAGVTAPAVGDTVKDAAVVNGYMFDLDASGSTKIEDYAVLIGSDNGAYATTAKLMFTDGTKKVVDTDELYDGTGGEANLGDLVTYEINSDNEYELTKVAYSATGTGFDSATSTNDITNSDGGSTSGKAKYINGWNVADDAVIFIKDTSDTSYEVITGAKLLTTAVASLDVVGAFADDNSSNGYSTVKLAYLTTSTSLTTADSLYGYAVADASSVKNSDGKVVDELTLWNGSKEVTVLAKNGFNASAVKEGDVVAYNVNSDGYIDALTIYDTDAALGANVAAITAYDGTYIQLNGGSTRYEIDKDDTTILYIDNGDVKGVEGGTIQKADKDGNDKYIPNAVVLVDGSDVDLIVFDVTNEISDTTSVTVAAADFTTDLFNTYDQVTVTGAYTVPAGNIAIPAAKTLVFNGAVTQTGNFVVTGTLVLNNNQAYDLSKVTAGNVNAIVTFGAAVATAASDYTGFFTTVNAGAASTALAAAPTGMTFKWLADGADATVGALVAGWMKQ